MTKWFQLSINFVNDLFEKYYESVWKVVQEFGVKPKFCAEVTAQLLMLSGER